jgi:hypothetical protein
MRELDLAQKMHRQIDLDFRESERQMLTLFPRTLLEATGDKPTVKPANVDRKPKKSLPAGSVYRSITPPKAGLGLLFRKFPPRPEPKKGQTAPTVMGIRRKFSLCETENDGQAREPEETRKARSVPGTTKPLLGAQGQ